ncbi:TetR family transcriptional regulator [Brevundimonas vesicularis]|uniref:TetR family transcriptional regulator n=1 Tax=Brevundimonas vesicularis TaxID=41276 RepID=UPI0038D41882
MARRANSSGESARDQLLEAASDLMTERTSVDITLSDLASRSGLNAALVKYYFGSKNGLLLEVLRKVLGPPMQELEPLLSMPLSAEEKLRVHISGVVNTYFRYPYVTRLMHYLLAEDNGEYGRVIAEEFSRPLADAQAAILAEGAREGIFRQVDPMLFYFSLIGACDHLFYGRYSLQHVFGVEGIDLDLKRRYVDHLYGIISQGLKA